MSDQQPKIDGVPIKLSGVTYVVPPLNFKLLKRHKADIDAITAGAAAAGGLDTETADRMVAVVHAALSRNYPDITIETVEDGLDLRNSAPIIRALLGQSGFVEEIAAGEAAAPQSSAPQSTGTTSTAS